jgi:dTMP kinase
MPFVVLEGVDGAGKSELGRRLLSALEALGARPLLLREPGSTALGERVRELLLDPRTGALDPTTEALLFSACRSEMTRREIDPALKAGRFVLLDRFVDSTAAYQGGGGGADAADLAALARVATGGLRPDLVFVLDLEPHVAATRRTGGKDRMESRDAAYFERVRNRYLAIAAAPENAGRYVVIDAALPRDAVFDAALSAIKARAATLLPKDSGR